MPKEFLEVYGGGQTLQLHNFDSLDFFGEGRNRTRARGVDKGQRGELRAFLAAVRSGGPMPIPFDCLLDTTLATVAAVESSGAGSAVELADLWTDGD